MDNNLKTYLNTRVNELLTKADLFQKQLISYRENFVDLRVKLQATKKVNPNTPISDVKDDLIRLQESHYNAFLLEQNLQHTLNVLIELGNMSNVLNIDLDLDEDKSRKLKDIAQNSSDLFMINGNNEVVFADNEIRELVEKTFKERNSNEELLTTLFEELPINN
jgi:phosphoglycolate phosphatase-like HAD superfamily hydrolase